MNMAEQFNELALLLVPLLYKASKAISEYLAANPIFLECHMCSRPARSSYNELSMPASRP